MLFLLIFSIYIVYISSRVQIAVDCGYSGKPYQGSDGIQYIQDNFYGTEYTYSHNQNKETIKNYFMEKTIFETYNSAPHNIIYELPLKHGIWTLVLIFSNLNRSGVFNIALGDYTIFNSIDTKKEYLLSLFIEIKISDDFVYYKGIECQNAYKFISQKLILEFKKITNSISINSIIIYEGVDKTHENEYNKFIGEELKDQLQRIEEDKILIAEYNLDYQQYLQYEYQQKTFCLYIVVFGSLSIFIEIDFNYKQE